MLPVVPQSVGSWSPEAVQRLLMGSSQRLIPVFVTFGFLAVSWLLVAVGMRQHERGQSPASWPPARELGEKPSSHST